MTAEDRDEPHPVIKEYERLAHIYDTRWAFYVETSLRETLARLSVSPRDRLLDVGCGTGALLHQLVHRFPEAVLVGIDPVPEMLSIAQQRLPEQVVLRKAWAERLPFEDASFDLVVSCNMFHYIRQPIDALHEMTRVLRRGGCLVITDWCDDYLACRLCDWYLRLFSPAHYKVYGVRGCRALLRHAGFAAPHIERYKISWLWGLMTIKVWKNES